MIRFLSIRDLAIVDQLEVEFDDGFNVLTGETGAGKSIIVGALGLLVGDRASSDLVRTGCDKAVVQATFDSPAGRETIVRREISARGRSRIFIDDALAPAATLKAIGSQLVDLHGQHEHQALLDPQAHVGLLDAYAGLEADVGRVSEHYDRWRRARTRIEHATSTAGEREERIDFLRFQLSEIDRAGPESGEDDRLSVERARLANAERLSALSSEAYAALYERDDSVLATLGGIWHQLEELATIDSDFESYKETRDGVNAPLDDIARTLRSYAASIDVSPGRLAEVEARLAELERLKRKHGGSLDAVFGRRGVIADELEALTGGDSQCEVLAAEVRAAHEGYVQLAAPLSKRRRRGADALAAAIETELADLALANARFEVRVDAHEDESHWSRTGTDSVEFFFSANPGEDPRPLSRIASGGEVARVMLALKTLASTDAVGKTLVFDEVDAGVGGQAADRVGERLRNLGRRFQVLCVTHTPQVAVHATTHFALAKHVDSGRTIARIERLTSEEGRAAEIARLMTGGTGAAALASAAELLGSKQKAKGERRKRKGENTERRPLRNDRRKNG